jgi:phosphoglycerate dehydrogenase-like enzyme
MPAERAIAVAPSFERVWPLVAPRLRELWPDAAFVRVDEETPAEAIPHPAGVTHLVSLGLPVEDPALPAFESLSAATVLTDSAYGPDADVHGALADRGVAVHWHDDEGFWSASVGEHALGLTLAALRRTPQLHARTKRSRAPWDYEPEGTPGPDPGGDARIRGHQYGDDPRFASGTLARKRVRVVGVGNIGSRYADAADALGADVAAYDPYADDPCFHRTGARRVHSLARLVADAEVFAPLVPPTPETEGLIDADLVGALATGTLVVLATRARIVDGTALRERVLDGDLALAADVFDGDLAGEPVDPDDELLDCEHVVHTPHVAGRTEHANRRWAERLLARFDGGVDPGDGSEHVDPA